MELEVLVLVWLIQIPRRKVKQKSSRTRFIPMSWTRHGFQWLSDHHDEEIWGRSSATSCWNVTVFAVAGCPLGCVPHGVSPQMKHWSRAGEMPIFWIFQSIMMGLSQKVWNMGQVACALAISISLLPWNMSDIESMMYGTGTYICQFWMKFMVDFP